MNNPVLYVKFILIQRKGDYLRKKFIVFLFSLFLIVFLSDEGITETDMISNNITNVINIDEHSDKQHDLIYRNYGLSAKLSSNSDLKISQLDLRLNGENAIICVINLKNNEVVKLIDYQPNQYISYTPASDGVFKIVAYISNGEIIDLTPLTQIKTEYSLQ